MDRLTTPLLTASRFASLGGWGGTRLPSTSMLVFLAALLTIGALSVHSASAAGASSFPGPLARSHLVRMAIGGGFLVFFLVVHYRQLGHWAAPLYGVGLLLLAWLLLQRILSGGEVVRWIHLGPLNLQPSELIKLFVILMLARVLRATGRSRTHVDHALPLMIVAIPGVLVALQPDLGTALVLPPVLLAMLWTSGGRLRNLALLSGFAVALLPIGWFFLRDYQRLRLLVFLDPDDPAVREASYQVRQSLIAIGSGGVTGKGYTLGSQNYLGYLPEDHNDFIFAVIGEEWGLVGTLCTITLFLFLYLSCLGIAYRTRDPFGRLVVVGVTTQLAFQTAVNIAMTCGVAPVTGLPLPFISYGGSSLLVSLASIGIVLGIGMRPVRILAPDGLRAGSSIATR